MKIGEKNSSAERLGDAQSSSLDSQLSLSSMLIPMSVFLFYHQLSFLKVQTALHFIVLP